MTSGLRQGAQTDGTSECLAQTRTRTRGNGAGTGGNGDEQTLPVRQENDRLDQRKLEQWLEGRQQLMRA